MARFPQKHPTRWDETAHKTKTSGLNQTPQPGRFGAPVSDCRAARVTLRYREPPRESDTSNQVPTGQRWFDRTDTGMPRLRGREGRCPRCCDGHVDVSQSIAGTPGGSVIGATQPFGPPEAGRAEVRSGFMAADTLVAATKSKPLFVRSAKQGRGPRRSRMQDSARSPDAHQRLRSFPNRRPFHSARQAASARPRRGMAQLS